MTTQAVVDTEELIESMGRFRNWVLPAGVMKELLDRGAEIAPALHRHLKQALLPDQGGIEQHAPEAFFCFHLLGCTQVPCHDFIDQLLRSGNSVIERCTGGVTNSYFRALLASFADKDDPVPFYEWVNSLVQDDEADPYGRLQAIFALFNLVGDNVLQYADVVSWTRSWLNDRKELKQDEFSAMIVADLIDVGGKDLKDLAVECFQRDQIDEGYVDIGCLDEMPDDFQVDLLQQRAKKDRQLLLDPISYLQTWHAFAWSTESFDPQNATYEPVADVNFWRNSEPDSQEIDEWLSEIDRATYDFYPRSAIGKTHRYIEHAVKQLNDRARRGIDSARNGESFSSNAPYLAALMLAKNCDARKVMITDPDLFLDIVDLISEQRYEWFGDTIDTHLIEALSHVLAGKPEPILQRLGDSSRSAIDRAGLINFFPMSVYEDYLSRNRCLEILKESWASFLGEGETEDADRRLILGTIYDAFCMLAVPVDDPVMVEAEEAGIGNQFMTDEVAAVFRNEPLNARETMKTKVLGPWNLAEAVESGVQFSSEAINPPQPQPQRASLSTPSHTHSTNHSTIRGSQKVGRNSPCTCGSGKKFKKCCGKR